MNRLKTKVRRVPSGRGWLPYVVDSQQVIYWTGKRPMPKVEAQKAAEQALAGFRFADTK